MIPKFRAFYKPEKKMYPVIVIDLVQEKGGLFLGRGKGPVSWEDIELLQFTGLKDRNGVEIYEGHILQYYDSEDEKYFRAEVKWSNDYASWFPIGMHNAEVLGNIYENPELLKEE